MSASSTDHENPYPASPEAMSDQSADTRDGPVIPGIELHKGVYISVGAAFALMFLVAWIAFGSGREIDFNLAVASALALIFLALPWMIYTTAKHHVPSAARTLREFLASDVDTATGQLSGSEAWLQILLIPAALAVAAILIGAVRMFAG